MKAASGCLRIEFGHATNRQTSPAREAPSSGGWQQATCVPCRPTRRAGRRHRAQVPRASCPIPRDPERMVTGTPFRRHWHRSAIRTAMKSRARQQPAAKPQPGRTAVMYVRVSSKEQEQGFSIPAQRQLLTEYAQRESIHVVQEFEDVETAKRYRPLVVWRDSRLSPRKNSSSCRSSWSRRRTGCTATSRTG